MGRQAKKASDEKKIDLYDHKGKERVNNPPVGLVTAESDKDFPRKSYSYDPHIDPQLQWAGKAERLSFDVPTVSLHVHERIDPRTIISVAKSRATGAKRQASLFEFAEENPPLREAVEFYKHKHNWSNRLIAGDSLLVMNSLLEKEGMAGQVQMVYIDPPYGIKYGSNFQPFVDKRDVKDGKDEDLSQEPEMIKAFRDTWELGVHSYLSYLRDRLILVRELLSESGSIFIQIGDENVDHVKEILSELFGRKNFVSLITFRKKNMPFGAKNLERMSDYIVWYAKNIDKLKYNPLFLEKDVQGASRWNWAELPNGKIIKMTNEQWHNHSLLPKGSRIFTHASLKPSGFSANQVFDVEFEGKIFKPPYNGCWTTTLEGMKRLIKSNRIVNENDNLRYKLYLDDYPVSQVNNLWTDTSGESDKIYVVQTSTKAVQRCLIMATDPGDLVLDITCGSGTTAYVAEQWGRRWITCDTSRVALTLSKQRLITAEFPYYSLNRPEEGVQAGFVYKTVPHITLGSIANKEPQIKEKLLDNPEINSSKIRVSGPFTFEAVPSPTVKPLSDIIESDTADETIARAGETLRESEWRSELFKTGIRGKGGQKIEFTRVEPLPGLRGLHADAETKEEVPRRVVVSFGPEHAPLERRQVERAILEADKLVPKPNLVVFAAFQFDPEASKDIDETNWTGVTLLKAQMNADLLTEDLKKKRASNESFWLIGQPDVKVIRLKDGPDKGKYVVEVQGFDYYNVKTGIVESGGSDKIALWSLDTDYDRRSLYPRQVFFPLDGDSGGWAKIAKSLKAELDPDLIKHFQGTTSIPFEIGVNRCIAVKIVDDRGIESLRLIEVD